MTASVTIRIHHQLTESQRAMRGDDYLHDRTSSEQRSRKRACYLHKREWKGGLADRYNGGYKHFGPGWLLPRVLATVTASMVWGICGKMADIPEY